MHCRQLICAIIVAFLQLACDKDPTTQQSSKISRQHSEFAEGEGEFLVQVFQGGLPTGPPENFRLELVPDPETALRLSIHDSLSMTINPNARVNSDWGAEWYDPDASEGPCRPIDQYELDNLDARGAEVHGGTGKERHCIRPGKYTAILYDGGIEVWSAEVEYVQAALADGGGGFVVTNSTAGVSERLISPTYQSRGGSQAVVDFILHIDLDRNDGFTNSTFVDIDTARNDARKASFSNDTSPQGLETDNFRISVARSQSDWNRTGVIRGGKMLTRFWWDFQSPGYAPTGYIDAHPAEEGHLIASFKYGNRVTESRLAKVGVDHKRPDELESNQPESQRLVSVTKSGSPPPPPPPCFGFEGLNTWKQSDQYFTVGCAPRGTGISYQWQFTAGGPITTTFDTLVDFRGHDAAGTHAISLTAKNGATTLGVFAGSVDVTTSAVTIVGPTWINNKNTQKYFSNMISDWYERFNPQLAWTLALVGEDSLMRIWPEGDYTAEVRANASSASQLRRGRLSLTVCRYTCSAELLARRPADDLETSSRSPVFGAGPVITWGSSEARNVLALYDLFGMHEKGSPFARIDWMSQGGQFNKGPFTIVWSDPVRRGEGVTAYEVSVIPETHFDYSFGFAIDPDLGTDAADDRAFFESARQLVYATDNSLALGTLILENGRPVKLGVNQYGAANLPPSSRNVTWSAQRQQAVRLLSRSDDVQFLVSTATRTGIARYTVVFLEGNDSEEIIRKADALLR